MIRILTVSVMPTSTDFIANAILFGEITVNSVNVKKNLFVDEFDISFLYFCEHGKLGL